MKEDMNRVILTLTSLFKGMYIFFLYKISNVQFQIDNKRQFIYFISFLIKEKFENDDVMRLENCLLL